ncbi:MAG: YciI family protein [Bryobacteraceae bacterium]
MRLLPLLFLALPLFAQDVPMRFYILAILEKGPKWTKETTPEITEMQKGHMANIGRLAKEGKLILAGPLADAGDAAGIFLFDTASVEEARKWCDTDPAIAAGRFQVRLMKWYSAKGIGILPASK